jgi:DNA-nicking Smr family endonuclease
MSVGHKSVSQESISQGSADREPAERNNAADDTLFRAEVGDVQPLQVERRVALNRSPISGLAAAVRREAAVRELSPYENFLVLGEIELIDPYYPLEFRRAGVQHGVFRKLKQGKYPMDARLDLHRMTVERARDEVFAFIREAVAYELRNVLIVPGRGSHSRAAEAVLKSYLNRWLPDFEDVQAFCSAQPQHGGTGAVYVMLKKSERQRQQNREQFNKGRVAE